MPRDLPLSWMTEKLYRHVWRLEHLPRGHADVVDDALAVLALSAVIGTEAQRDGVRQAMRAGATAPEIGRALEISIAEAQHGHRARGEDAAVPPWGYEHGWP